MLETTGEGLDSNTKDIKSMTALRLVELWDIYLDLGQGEHAQMCE